MRERCLLVSDDEQAMALLAKCLQDLRPGVLISRASPAGFNATTAADFDVVILQPAAGFAQATRMITDTGAASPDAQIGLCLPRKKPQWRRGAYELGVTEIFDLPLEAPACACRMAHLVESSRQKRLLSQMQDRIRQRREAAWSEALELETELLRRLSQVSAHNDPITHRHQQRTAQLAGRISRRMGLGEEQADLLQRATYLHDIGKIGIPTAVLCKVGRFDTRDRRIMSRHPLIGHEILRDSNTPEMQLGAVIALSHHERFDGSGYPHGLGGEEIPLPARIAAVADVYDSLTEQRRYNRTRPAGVALDQLDRIARDGQLDSECVRALRAALNEPAPGPGLGPMGKET